jgi:hypothetical protein
MPLRSPGRRSDPEPVRSQPAQPPRPPAGATPSPATDCSAPRQVQTPHLGSPRRPAWRQDPRPPRHEQAGRAADRRIPAGRSSRAGRSRRRAPHGRPRPTPRQFPLALPHSRARHAQRRRSQDAEALPCSRTASGSRRSCRRSERFPRTTRRPLRVQAPGCRWERRGRSRGADLARTGGRGRMRTAAARDRRPARSRPVRPAPVERVRKRAVEGVAARFSSLLPTLRTNRP